MASIAQMEDWRLRDVSLVTAYMRQDSFRYKALTGSVTTMQALN